MNFKFDDQFLISVFNTCTQYENLLDKDNHLFVDLRKFPQMIIDVKHPCSICKEIPEDQFYYYNGILNKADKVLVLLHDTFIMISSLDDGDDNEDIRFIMDKYVKAYINGLLKVAWNEAKDSNSPVVFAVVDGEVTIIYDKDIQAFFDVEGLEGAYDEWYDLCVENNPCLLSFFYTDSSNGCFWYDIVKEDFQNYLEDYYGS